MPNLKEFREKAGLTQAALATLARTSQQQIQRLETGERRLTKKWARRLGPLLNCSAADLAPDDEIDTVTVFGYVGGGAEIYPYDNHSDENGLELVEAPPEGSEGIVAVRVRGDSMYPAYRENDLIFYCMGGTDAADFLNRECVVKCSDGRLVVKTVLGAAGNASYTLASHNAPPIQDVVIEWAAPIRWVKR